MPSQDQIREFLHVGALFAWSEDRWIIAWGSPEKRARPCADRPSFYAPDFFLTDPAPWRVYPQGAAVSPDGLAHHLGTGETARVWNKFDEASFASAFAKVQSALQQGELRKAVPAVFEHSAGPLSIPERERALRALANLPGGLIPYGFWDQNGGLLGASPELLFEDDGVEVHTMAVAGTAGADTAPDAILENPKELSEHRVVLDDLAAQLSPLGRITRGATRLWRIGILSHLRTDLRVAHSPILSFDDLVSRLHPTPAVGAAPRELWRSWIPQLDSEPRGHFAAPFGLLLPGGQARCLVAIRHMQWNDKITRVGAGCGLVAGSDLVRETAELRLKLAATRGNLGL
jgi:menaquinone-specific isochorismate synthase